MFSLLFLSFICSGWGLECYTLFDERNNRCSKENQHHNFYETAEDCCESSKAVAYSEISLNNWSKIATPENETIECTSCKRIREAHKKVFCYQKFSADLRVCQSLHLQMASSIEDCCAYRASNNLTKGFNFQKFKLNSHEEKYECIPCVEAIIPASEWSAWTQCNSSCGGGYKQRNNMCKKDTFYPSYALCVDLKTEILNCNDEPCPQNRKISNSIIALIVTILLMVFFVVGFLIRYFWKKYAAARTKPSKYSLGVAYNKSSLDLTNSSRTMTSVTSSRYGTSPKKRELPTIPSENPPINGADFHTYADIQSTEYYDNGGYLSMTGKIETYSNVTI